MQATCKQDTIKIQATCKQDTSKIQTTYKQDTSKIQAPCKQHTSKIQATHKQYRQDDLVIKKNIGSTCLMSYSSIIIKVIKLIIKINLI
jgi:hypothetical protein